MIWEGSPLPGSRFRKPVPQVTNLSLKYRCIQPHRNHQLQNCQFLYLINHPKAGTPLKNPSDHIRLNLYLNGHSSHPNSHLRPNLLHSILIHIQAAKLQTSLQSRPNLWPDIQQHLQLPPNFAKKLLSKLDRKI